MCRACISVSRTLFMCIIYTVSRLSTVFAERYGGTKEADGAVDPRRRHGGVRPGRSGAAAPESAALGGPLAPDARPEAGADARRRRAGGRRDCRRTGARR